MADVFHDDAPHRTRDRWPHPDELHSADECFDAMQRMDFICGDIQGQLDAACADYNETGTPSDSDWLLRTQAALRLAKRRRKAVQERRGQISRAEKQKAQVTNDALFSTVARRILPPEVFKQICDEVVHEREQRVSA